MKLRKFYQQLPSSWQCYAESLPIKFFSWRHSRSVLKSFRSGPPYRPSHRRIIIDITESCDLGCVDCSRSCGRDQAPSDANMTLEQVNRFIQESNQQGRKWEMIQIEGGEPTLHPDFLEIVSTLDQYIRCNSPGAVLQVNTNGYSESSRRLLSRLPSGVSVYCSSKTERKQDQHLAFNQAPVDLDTNSGLDFSQGCFLPDLYGLGLTRHGYYPHPNCGGIDRVFGFDIGRKTLPWIGDGLDEQFPQLCRDCGLFSYLNRSAVPASLRSNRDFMKGSGREFNPGEKSESWRSVYQRFLVNPPVLTDY